jgi:hypothetical protein
VRHCSPAQCRKIAARRTIADHVHRSSGGRAGARRLRACLDCIPLEIVIGRSPTGGSAAHFTAKLAAPCMDQRVRLVAARDDPRDDPILSALHDRLWERKANLGADVAGNEQ